MTYHRSDPRRSHRPEQREVPRGLTPDQIADIRWRAQAGCYQDKATIEGLLSHIDWQAEAVVQLMGQLRTAQEVARA